MSTKLVEHLKQKAEQDENVSILLSQWEFDRKLVSKALEGIVSYFPHFSSHNASHSEQILVNIERLLGDSIQYLSATDTWLLLESAYWHDIGMIVDSKSAMESLNDEGFQDHLRGIAQNPSHDLHDFAKNYLEEGWLASFNAEGHPHKAMETYRLLLADWFRAQHPNRAEAIVMDPWAKLSINSPRTELLPQRLYRYLGQICMMHGRRFDDVMAELPYKQTGLGTEDCHPRFIAYMLRLGDLFDLDDNRFCPVMQRHLDEVPSLSQAHQQKHLALREFQLDRETIRIVAVCPDEASYIETQNWFSWIREEVQLQMANWKNIVPNRHFGLLPTIEQLDVQLEAPRVLLNKVPMRFGLDEPNTLEILQGSNIYEDEINVYRELIQNAIDATMIRVWLEHGPRGDNTLPDNAHPYEEKTQEILQKYPITLDFKKIKDVEDSDDAIWEFSITDNGTGISENDLQYMQKLAGSNRNQERQRIIHEMPKWMRPSGSFGIGLHSAFLLTDNNNNKDQCIHLETKSIFTHKSLDITLYSPTSKKQGYCFIRENSTNSFGNYGTTLNIQIKLTKISLKNLLEKDENIILFMDENKNEILSFLKNNYDPLMHITTNEFEALTQIGCIYQKILPNVNLYIKLKPKWTSLVKHIYNDNKINNVSILKYKKYWSDKYQVYISINFFHRLQKDHLSKRNGSFFYFKGQLVSEYHDGLIKENEAIINHSSIQADFYGLNAIDALNINRNEWNPDIIKELNKIVLKSIHEALTLDPDCIKNQAQSSEEFSLFIHLFDKNNKYPNLHSECWKNFILDKNQKIKISDLLKREKFIIIFNNDITEREINSLEMDSQIPNIKDYPIYNISNVSAISIIGDVWKKNGGIESSILLNSNERRGFVHANIFDKKLIQKSTFNLFEKISGWVLSSEARGYLNVDFLKQNLYQRYKPLSIKSLDFKELFIITNSDDIIILPFVKFISKSGNLIISDSNLDRLAKRVWESRDQKYSELTVNDYLDLYKKLIEEIDEAMNTHDKWRKSRKEAKSYQTPEVLKNLGFS